MLRCSSAGGSQSVARTGCGSSYFHDCPPRNIYHAIMVLSFYYEVTGYPEILVCCRIGDINTRLFWYATYIRHLNYQRSGGLKIYYVA